MTVYGFTLQLLVLWAILTVPFIFVFWSYQGWRKALFRAPAFSFAIEAAVFGGFYLPLAPAWVCITVLVFGGAYFLHITAKIVRAIHALWPEIREDWQR
jgi:hypothetical protein